MQRFRGYQRRLSPSQSGNNSALFGELRRRAERLLNLRSTQCGAVTFVQRFGDALNANVHFHSMVIDGVYAAGTSGRPEFHQLPRQRNRTSSA